MSLHFTANAVTAFEIAVNDALSRRAAYPSKNRSIGIVVISAADEIGNDTWCDGRGGYVWEWNNNGRDVDQLFGSKGGAKIASYKACLAKLKKVKLFDTEAEARAHVGDVLQVLPFQVQLEIDCDMYGRERRVWDQFATLAEAQAFAATRSDQDPIITDKRGYPVWMLDEEELAAA